MARYAAVDSGEVYMTDPRDEALRACIRALEVNACDCDPDDLRCHDQTELRSTCPMAIAADALATARALINDPPTTP